MEGLLNKAKSTAAACASQQEPLPGDSQKKYSDTSVNHRVADGTSQADDDDDLDDFFDSLQFFAEERTEKETVEVALTVTRLCLTEI